MDQIKTNYENGVKCFLISVIYCDFTTGYYYKHGKEELTEFIKWLCSDENDEKVHDFRVFERIEIDF